MNETERFWSRVDASGDCWEWTRAHGDGYGQASFGGRVRYAHRVAWTLLVGPIPEGLELDHLCRNRGCVNPDHLEVVTHRVNGLRGYGACGINARKSRCKNGHAFDEANTHTARGRRRCRTCDAAAQRRYQSRLRAVA